MPVARLLPGGLKYDNILIEPEILFDWEPMDTIKTHQTSPQRQALWQDAKDILLSVFGGMLYALSVNFFVLPFGIYIGNLTGIAQILQELLKTLLPVNGDLTGVFLLALNLPLLLISFKSINRKFFLKTVLTVLATTLALQFIPQRALIPELDDLLTNCLVGGILAGFGIGLCLRSGGSSGGTDILGVYISMKHANFSVGQVSLFISLIVYIYVFFNYPLEVLVYSIIFTLICSFMVDRVHYQNVKMNVMVITKNRAVLPLIVSTTNRSATYWEGTGAYTGAQYLVVNTVLSQYEMINLRKNVLDLDPQAFIIENKGVHITGNFPSHFF